MLSETLKFMYPLAKRLQLLVAHRSLSLILTMPLQDITIFRVIDNHKTWKRTA